MSCSTADFLHFTPGPDRHRELAMTTRRPRGGCRRGLGAPGTLESGQYLYVTSGIGTSGLPVRWGVPPEFAVLDMLGKL
jgi:predicted MPP superfamily phosphohydrolase